MKNKTKIALFGLFFGALGVVAAQILTGSNFTENFSVRDFLNSVISTENIVTLTNASRRKVDLPLLRIDEKLQSAAQRKAWDMVKKQYFAHTSPEGETGWDFLEEADYDYIYAGENLAMNFNSAEEVTKGWLTSLTHRENILSRDFTEIGIGIAKGKFIDEETTIVVQMFGAPAYASAEKKNRTVTGKKEITPVLKKSSLRGFIEELLVKKAARWIPQAKAASIYGSPEGENSLPALVLIFLGACVFGAWAYHMYRNKRRT